MTGTTTDGPAGPLREQWTVRDPNVTGVVIVDDTVITAQAKGIVALDAATGAERWRYLLPDQEYWPGAVVSPSTGVVAFALDGVVVLLDIGSGKQVGLVALPAILSVEQWPYVDWRKSYTDSPTLFPVIESADEIVTTFVVQFLDNTNWTAMFSFSGLVVPTPTVTSIDTTTWQTVSTTNVGCDVSQLSAGPRLVVAMCGSSKLVGLAE